MICHSNSLSALGISLADRVSANESHISLVVGSFAATADVVEWSEERLVLSVHDPAHCLRDRLFVAQLMSFTGRNRRFTGTLQAMHPSSTGKFRLQVSWSGSVLDDLPIKRDETPTLCAC